MRNHAQENLSHNSELERLIRSNAAEFSRVEGNIISASGEGVPKSLLVTSCNPGEGKTTSSAVIGAAIASKGSSNVLLIDAHMGNPRLHKILDQPNSTGLAEVVLSKCGWLDAVKTYHGSSLHLLPAGIKFDNPLSIFRSPRFKTVIQELKEHYDCIIIDGPPFMGSSESAYLAPMVEGILLVVACEETRWQLVSIAKSKIEAVQGRLVGVVMNRRKYYIPKGLYKFL